jgi:hypothetical protein
VVLEFSFGPVMTSLIPSLVEEFNKISDVFICI